MLQAPITINHVFTGACNKSINMGKQLYNSEIHSKNIDNYKVDNVIKYTQKHRLLIVIMAGVKHRNGCMNV